MVVHGLAMSPSYSDLNVLLTGRAECSPMEPRLLVGNSASDKSMHYQLPERTCPQLDQLQLTVLIILIVILWNRISYIVTLFVIVAVATS